MERKYEKRDLSGLMNSSDPVQQERDSSNTPRGTLQTATGQYKLQTTQDQKTDYNWDEEDNWEPQANDSAAAVAPWAPKQTPKVDLQSAITNFKPTSRESQRDGLERFRTHKLERAAPVTAAPVEEWKRRGSSGASQLNQPNQPSQPSQGLRPLGRFTTAAAATRPAVAARPAASAPAVPAEPAVSAEETIAAQKRAMAEARERAAAARAAELEQEEQEKAARLAARLAELDRKAQPPKPAAPVASHKWDRSRGQQQQYQEAQPAEVDQDWGAAKKKGKGPLQSMRRQREERERERGERTEREPKSKSKPKHEHDDEHDEHDEHEQPSLSEAHLQKVVVKLPKYKTACNPKEILADLAHRAPQFAPEQKSNLPVRIQLPKSSA